jgi:hypothetical protein
MLFAAYFDHLWAILNGAGNGSQTSRRGKDHRRCEMLVIEHLNLNQF